MKKITFTNIEINDDEKNVSLTATINNRIGFGDEDVENVINSILNGITKSSNPIGGQSIRYTLSENRITANKTKI